MKARAKTIRGNRITAKARREGAALGDEAGVPPVDTVSSSSIGRVLARVAATVTGNGTAGGSHETEPGIRVQAVGVTECEEAVRLMGDEQSGGPIMAQSSWRHRGQG